LFRCPNCGAENEYGGQSCWNCGTRFVQEGVDSQAKEQPEQQHPNQQQRYQRPMQSGPTIQRRPKTPFYKKAPFILLIVALIIGAVIGTTYFVFLSDDETSSRELSDEEKLVGEWELVEEDGEPVDHGYREYEFWTFEEEGIGVIERREYDEWDDEFIEEEEEFKWEILEVDDYDLMRFEPDEPGPFRMFIEYEFIDDDTLEITIMGEYVTGFERSG